MDLKHWKYSLLEVTSTENQNLQLDSLFSPNVKLLGVHTAIGVDLLQFHLENFQNH